MIMVTKSMGIQSFKNNQNQLFLECNIILNMDEIAQKVNIKPENQRFVKTNVLFRATAESTYTLLWGALYAGWLHGRLRLHDRGKRSTKQLHHWLLKDSSQNRDKKVDSDITVNSTDLFRAFLFVRIVCHCTALNRWSLSRSINL